jgi:TolB protein
MKHFTALVSAVLLCAAAPSLAQEGPGIIGTIPGFGAKPRLAVTDFRGSGKAAAFMSTFNGTVFSDLQSAGLFDMVSKSMIPLQPPQRPEDFHAQSGTGLALQDWSGPPPNASHLAFGYAADQGGSFVAYGYLFDVRQPLVGAQMMAKRYIDSMDDNGARKAAHDFTCDITKAFGGLCLADSKIYFVSDRTGNQEIWVMEYDGTNQRQLTHNRGISNMPGISPDGTLLAYTSFRTGRPQIDILETASGRLRGFLNPSASINSTPSFTADGKTLYFASTVGGGPEQIYRCGVTGGGLSRVSRSQAIEVEPKVNPKNPGEIVFVSGRTGPQQVFRMNAEGLDVERLTNGEGEASNPSWHPDGQHILFSWTRGYAKGDWNVFLMDVASRRYDQLTHSEGRNENPVWAPDGRHLVFGSNRGGSYQIWSMLADGTAVTRLTNQGRNKQPVWSK